LHAKGFTNQIKTKRNKKNKDIDIYCKKKTLKKKKSHLPATASCSLSLSCLATRPGSPSHSFLSARTSLPPLRFGFVVLSVLFVVLVLFEWASVESMDKKGTSVFSSTQFNLFYFLKNLKT
jgi:hypothetical protein